DEHPDQGTHQRGDETFAVVHETQRLAPGDAVQTDQVLAEREAATPAGDRGAAHSGASSAPPVKAMNALRISMAPADVTTSETSPDASTRPRCSTMTASPGVTSSSKCVAHRT